LHVEVNERNGLYYFNPCKASLDVGCGTIRGDPVEYVFDGTTIFHTLSVAGNRSFRMECGAHHFRVVCACAPDVAVHYARNCVMFPQVLVGRDIFFGPVVLVIPDFD
jgi:hypothetical protein